MGSRTRELLRRERMQMGLREAIELFLIAKQIEAKSPRTIGWYRNLLIHFAKHVGDGKGAKLKDVSIDDAREFIASFQARTTRYDDHPYREQQEGGLSPSTIHAYVRTLKVFGTWLYEDGVTRHNLFARLKRPKLPKPVIKILAEQEIHSILDSINPNCFLGARQNLIVLLLLDTGIRASELCSLTLPNIYEEENKIVVKGKGRKERTVPFASATKRALMRYVNTWRPEPLGGGTDTLILSVNGTPLTYNGLSLAIRRLGKRAGVPRLHAHLFRHTFAVLYLMNGGDVMSLKRILGHTTLDVTQAYIHLAEAHVKVQHQKFSPVDRLGLGRGRRRQR